MKTSRPAIPPPAPPKAPVQTVTHLHVEMAALRKLEIRDGDVVCLPADTHPEQVQAFADAMGELRQGTRMLFVMGDLQSLDEAAMNAAGWYRK